MSFVSDYTTRQKAAAQQKHQASEAASDRTDAPRLPAAPT